MAYWKKIKNSNAVPVLKDELVFDQTPTVNSTNPVTSDGVARAIAGASGEVPVVTQADDGKILTAIYDEGGPAVEWADAQEELPSVTGNSGKILAVNSGATGVEWVDKPEGAVYTAGDGIAISSGNVVSVNHDATLKAEGASTTYQYGTKADLVQDGFDSYYYALSVQLPDDLSSSVSFKLVNGGLWASPIYYSNMGGFVTKLRLCLANPSDLSKNVLGTVTIAATADAGSDLKTPITWSAGVLGEIFDWSSYTLADVKDSSGNTYVYIICCQDSGAACSGTWGPGRNCAAARFGTMGSVNTYPLFEIGVLSEPKLSVTTPVPTVGSGDNGKVLGAVYNNGATSVGWKSISEVPVATVMDGGKVLTATYSGGVVSTGWANVPTELPSVAGNAGKVLSVNAGATGVEWATVQSGSSYTAGDGIAISAGDVISVNYGDTLGMVNSSAWSDTGTALSFDRISYGLYNTSENSAIISAVSNGGKLKVTLTGSSESSGWYGDNPNKPYYCVLGLQLRSNDMIINRLVLGNPIPAGSNNANMKGLSKEYIYDLRSIDSDQSDCTAQDFVTAYGNNNCKPVFLLGQYWSGENYWTYANQYSFSSAVFYTETVTQKLGVTTPVPTPGNSDSGKVLTVSNNSGAFGWAAVPTELPAVTGNAGKVLTVNSGATGVEWANAGGSPVWSSDASMTWYSMMSRWNLSTLPSFTAGDTFLVEFTISVSNLSSYTGAYTLDITWGQPQATPHSCLFYVRNEGVNDTVVVTTILRMTSDSTAYDECLARIEGVDTNAPSLDDQNTTVSLRYAKLG